MAVLDDLGIARAHFFGYSMGGWIGFGVARHAPGRLRSLIIGGQHPLAQSMDEIRQLVRYAVENGPAAFVALLEKRSGAPSPAEKERMLTHDYEALLSVAQDRESLEDVLTRIKVPCLLFAGETDEVHPLAKECAKQIANATFVSLPGLDHGEAISHSAQILPHLKKFLAAVSQGAH